MRILHTSDWHLGRSFHREGLLGHQAAYVDHLLEVIDAEQVDLVVVAGDIYDRALPPVDAVRLANEAFTRIAHSRARLVVTSGNHDSAQRLGFGADLMDAAGVHIRASALSVGTPVLLEDEHGTVAVHGLPYLDPDLLHEPWQLPARSHEAVVGEAMRRVRADLATRPGVRSVVMAHGFFSSAARPVETSDSERDISVGGVSMVSTDVFDGIDYAALGHLHGRHTLTETVRYSGSPLAYSFSEAHHRKGSWLVDLGAAGVTSTEFIDAPVPRRLARISGTLADLLADASLARHEDAWVQATLTDAVRPAQAMERLRRRFPHTLVLSFQPPGGHRPGSAGAAVAAGRSDHEIALDFVDALRGRPASPAEAALLRDACDACSPDRDLDTVVS
ncbi:exonuclease SbcCD subunit D [Nocardioides sp. AE5]|uniref:exonuclease SbcCD subunit D n=1 Tax=Nocardioides sp. AE5 TaxID=2962573 RepID=UPI0028818EA6|nr:exonuclease SbcCD subunit D [Nocardioides sp. AE5]MDT0201444.1 exonuclease SbcCD subunit D [Nocardioides sp. AE5]